jgi:DNA-binding NarL/FixJ family response regulator
MNSPSHEHKLTPRENDVLQSLASGKSRKETAKLLELKDQTIKGVRTKLYKKLSVTSDDEALLLALTTQRINTEMIYDDFDLSGITKLTYGEYGIYRLLLDNPGVRRKDIGSKASRVKSEKTVANQVTSICKKLGVNDRSGIVLFEHALTRIQDHDYFDGTQYNPLEDQRATREEIEVYRRSSDQVLFYQTPEPRE